jgi:D-alanine--poly(phosphoribitol) ligase subunit 1
MNHNLAAPFYRSASAMPSALALWAEGRSYTYGELQQTVVRIATWLTAGSAPPERVGILASRSMEACAGILAAAAVGATYVPISLKQPEAGLIGLLRRCNLGALIVDSTGAKMLSSGVLAECPAKVLVAEASSKATPITPWSDLPSDPPMIEPIAVDPQTTAYILFTSGSTGQPKGVMIPAGAVAHFLGAMQAQYPIAPSDRVAETAETSFDISVYNMFATWYGGASLHVIPRGLVMAPAQYIKEHEISTWFSVPAVAVMMKRMGLLAPGSFPSLRYTFFCGEPLLASTAEAWQRAAPASVVVNMYGPTEATVMCTGEEYRPQGALSRDWLAIGRPYDGLKAAILAAESEQAPELADSSTPGELVLSGPQLALGYFDDPQLTGSCFVMIGGDRWYKTGDLARRDADGVFHYLGRIDNQVKVLGYRVELEDIESHLREVSGCDTVAAVAWPIQGASAAGIVAFVVNYEGSPEDLKLAMRQRLAAYMCPTRVHVVRALPMNNNGKVDRRKLRALLEDGVTP